VLNAVDALGDVTLQHRQDRSLPGVSFGVYVHVPWCSSRCGYCDFNTYVPRGNEPAGFAATAVAEIALMRAEVGDVRPSTVFFGGGTPTLLEPADLALVLAALDPAPGAEVTVEANPETVDPGRLEALRAAGFTRVSVGMQSAVDHVLHTLDRVHTPGRAPAAAREARAAGFDHVSLDLIYGTPGESDEDWRVSVDAALAAEPDHVSAYALTVEPGTRLMASVRAGRLPAPDEDALARRYEIADAAFTAAGLEWYEVCNWAATEAARCRHNINYWTGGDYWAIGPGAHGHMGGTRFWTHRNPARHAAAVAAGELPVSGREELDADAVELERVMLGVRLAEGIRLTDAQRPAAATLHDDGLLHVSGDRAVLTDRGRRLANIVIRALV
jgi:oxygen-independent coproporphyrinogen-3 oxidase